MSKNKHKRAQKFHFIKRFKERIGIELTEKEYFELRDKCLTDESKFLSYHGENPHKCILALKYKEFDFCVVYDMFKKRLVTVLPRNIRKI